MLTDPKTRSQQQDHCAKGSSKKLTKGKTCEVLKKLSNPSAPKTNIAHNIDQTLSSYFMRWGLELILNLHYYDLTLQRQVNKL